VTVATIARAPSVGVTALPDKIVVARASKVYDSGKGGITALKDIDLAVGRGEFLSILGPSGCGKSTLLKCIGGLQSVSSGRITIEGHEVTEPPVDSGFVFQRDLLLDWRTVIDNVLLPVEIRRLAVADWKPRALELLHTLGIGHCPDLYPWELSGGMRQRVALCRSLLLEPNLLLMDEPFGALDAITRDELNMETERIWERTKKTVILITHSISEAVFLSDRVVVMTPAPGTIAEIIPIDLPRPRTLAIRETPAFAAYQRQLRSIFEALGIMKRAVA
jgi:NitT/TauT family transport system ATP-binding protein